MINNSGLKKIGQEVIEWLQSELNLNLLIGILIALTVFFLFLSLKTSLQNRQLKKHLEKLSQEHEDLVAAYTAQDLSLIHI